MVFFSEDFFFKQGGAGLKSEARQQDYSPGIRSPKYLGALQS